MTVSYIDRVKLNSVVLKDGMPEWIKLVPAGSFTGRDGRGPYTNHDPDAVIKTTNADLMEAGLPIDLNHATFKPGDGGNAPAVGWIKELANREGEIWGRVEWTKKGQAAIGDKDYRYISPAFLYGPDGRVKKVLNAGLTNNPNLYYTAICSRKETIVAGKTKEQKEKDRLALNGMVDEMHEKIKKAADKTGVPHHAFLSALADKAVGDAGGGDDDDEGGGTKYMADDKHADGCDDDDCEGCATPVATESRDDESKGADRSGDGDKDLEAEMKALQDMEGDLDDDENELDPDDEEGVDAEETFTQRCEAASQLATKAGRAELAADFSRMARASKQRAEMKQALNDPDKLDQLAEQALKNGRTAEAKTIKRLALMVRKQGDDNVGLTKEEVRALFKEELATHTKDLRADLDAIKGGNKQDAAVAFVDQAIRERRLTPAERDDYIALHVKDSKTAVALVAKRVPIDLAAETFSSEVPTDEGKTALMSRGELAICASLGVTPKEFVARKKVPLDQLSVGIRQ
jgi:phage I-like protein